MTLLSSLSRLPTRYSKVDNVFWKEKAPREGKYWGVVDRGRGGGTRITCVRSLVPLINWYDSIVIEKETTTLRGVIMDDRGEELIRVKTGHELT